MNMDPQRAPTPPLFFLDKRASPSFFFFGVRANPEKSKENTDILQVFIDMVYKKTGDPSVDGKGNTDDQIVGLLIALLFAGQHTSSITSTWTTLFLAHDKPLWDRARKEVEAVVPKVKNSRGGGGGRGGRWGC